MTGQRTHNQTYYEILEVRPGAPQNEIHAAYKRAKAAYSPDSPALYTMFTQEEARELLKLIEEAYATLSNQASRKEYDLKLKANQNSSDSQDMELPDFDPEDVKDIIRSREANKPVRANPTPPPKKETVPEGFRKTRYSVYEIDPEFEEEIRSCSEFDGQMIQRVRQYKKVNLEQMSEVSRISKTYLAAVENNDYRTLPAPVFVRGFVVQMARILELDEKHVADSYMKILRQNSP